MAVVSIGDHGALNTRLPDELSEIWIDLSWLDFNQRVLAEALDERTPLLERTEFLAIFTSNLDEFFMKRVSIFTARGRRANIVLYCNNCGRSFSPCLPNKPIVTARA